MKRILILLLLLTVSSALYCQNYRKVYYLLGKRYPGLQKTAIRVDKSVILNASFDYKNAHYNVYFNTENKDTVFSSINVHYRIYEDAPSPVPTKIPEDLTYRFYQYKIVHLKEEIDFNRNTHQFIAVIETKDELMDDYASYLGIGYDTLYKHNGSVQWLDENYNHYLSMEKNPCYIPESNKPVTEGPFFNDEPENFFSDSITKNIFLPSNLLERFHGETHHLLLQIHDHIPKIEMRSAIPLMLRKRIRDYISSSSISQLNEGCMYWTIQIDKNKGIVSVKTSR